MKDHCCKVYLDNRRAGHAYLELLPPGTDRGEVYGFYPAKYDEKKEVLFGEGQVRKDRSRLDDVRDSEEDRQIVKSVDLEAIAFNRLTDFLTEQEQKPNYYFLLGYNCIDFIQDAYKAAFGPETDHFLSHYTEAELEELGYLGVYAELQKAKRWVMG